ncbi:hypothetical protein BEL04_13125 [Mucilaginibacter sp. PPCGB 2223]|uniref:hypothetical protein n=1 Tax=Mucilaginibacter sp. PPCGB 2223 TaxID=1886027 RepID=UPI0008240B2F|nr:hypothetical protein [Mucilaginibacter sp. PPCGB 2223]OCX52404.1 hypothetical protein BEL04_13125 [Mucilaginibacter sp. PPCGB 2223]
MSSLRYPIYLTLLILTWVMAPGKVKSQDASQRTPVQIDSIISSKTAKNGKLDSISGGYDGHYTFYKKIIFIKTNVEKGFYFYYTLLFNKQLFYREENYSSTNLKTPKHTIEKFYFLNNQPVKFVRTVVYGDFKNPASKNITTIYLDQQIITQVNTSGNRQFTAKQLSNFQNYINSKLPCVKTSKPLLF